MIRTVDLMPESYRKAYGKRTAIRRWSMIYVTTLALIGGGYFALAAGQESLEAELAALDADLKLEWERNVEAQGLLAEIKNLEQTIRRYERLAWPVRVTDAVTCLGEVMPETLTLTSLTLTPFTEQKRGSAKRGSGKEDEAPPKTVLVVEAEGLSPDDIEIARFVSKLDEHPLFEQVTLDYARHEDVDEQPARAFRLALKIDLSARYVFLSPTEIAESAMSAAIEEVTP